MISAARAREIKEYIWSHHGGSDPCTPEERREIKAVWDRCPGTYTFYDAVCRVEKEAQERETAGIIGIP